MDFNKFFQSKIFKIIVFGIAGLIAVLLVFQAGMMVGFKKANFSYRWGENYHRNFAGPRNGFFEDFIGKDFIDAHGVFGSIIKIDPSTLIIKGMNDLEKIILLKDDSVIKRFQDTVRPDDLKVGEYIVVIGSPNDAGQIEAKLIRILPPPPTKTSPSSQPLPLPAR